MPAYYTACPRLFVVCLGTTPGLATASYRWTSFSYIPQLSVPSRGTSWCPAYRLKAGSGFCHRPPLHSGLALCGAGPPLLCAAVEHRQKMEERGGFPGQGFHFFMLNFKPNAFLWLKQDKGQQASTLQRQANWNEGDLTLVPRQSSVMHLGTPTSLLRIPGISCIKKCL